MTQTAKELIGLIGAIGGLAGFGKLIYDFAKSQNGYIKESACSKRKEENNINIKDLHEKVNKLTERVVRVETKIEDKIL